MKKQRWEESGRRSQEVRRSEKRKSEKQEDAGARKGRKVTIHCVFPMIWGSRSKSNLAKAAGAEPSGLDEWKHEKLHAIVARRTFPSQNVQSTPGSDHFWKLRCRKSARCCGVKHVSKSKCTKHARLGPLFGSWDVEKVHAVVARSTFPSQNVQSTRGTDHFLEVEMSKKCRRLWREAHFQVKSVKSWGFWAFSDVQMWKKWTLTNFTNLTNLTDLATLSQLTNKQTNKLTN